MTRSFYAGDRVPDEVLIEAYGRLGSCHKVAAEVGMNHASVSWRLSRAGVQFTRGRPRGVANRAALRQTERDFQATVIELAQWLGWRAYHTWVSMRSASGFPDLVLVKAPRVIFAELKVSAPVSPAQQDWLAALGACPGVETYLWRPSDIERITAILKGEVG